MEVTITNDNFESYKNGELPLVVDCGQHGAVLAARLLLSFLNSPTSMMASW